MSTSSSTIEPAMKENVDPQEEKDIKKVQSPSTASGKSPTSTLRRRSSGRTLPDSATKRQKGVAYDDEPVTTSPIEIVLDALYEDSESTELRKIYNTTIEAKRLRQTEAEPSAEVCSFPEFKKRLTYGEVKNHAFINDILPVMCLTKEDVFYDVGCGTGKVLFLVTLHANCPSKGIELAKPRVAIAKEAWNRLRCLEGKMPSIPRKITEKIHIIEGDACAPPPEADLSDATVVFVNNVCFDAPLMSAILERVTAAKKLRMLVTMRKICTRHRESGACQRNERQCMKFLDPPQETRVKVTWTDESTVYFYTVAPSLSPM